MKKYFISYFVYHKVDGDLKFGADAVMIWSSKRIDNEVELKKVGEKIIEFQRKKYGLDLDIDPNGVKIIFFKKVRFSCPSKEAIIV